MLSAILLSALRKAMSFRSDGQPQLRYFLPQEYGLTTIPFSFRSGKWLLRGEKFLPEGKPKALVVFFHGFGAGYTAYTQEISLLVKAGYLVYAYDNTGCMTSEGEGVGCFAQALLDQKEFFAFLEQEDIKGLPRYAIGHSWGGYAALGALKPEYGIEKTVSISGFIDLAAMLIHQEPKLKRFESYLRKALDKGYGKGAGESLLPLMASSTAKVLYIQGENDLIVPKDDNYDVLAEQFKIDPRVRLMLVKGAMHNPYWTLEGEAYLARLSVNARLLQRDYDNGVNVDYSKLMANNPKVMEAILTFLGEKPKP